MALINAQFSATKDATNAYPVLIVAEGPSLGGAQSNTEYSAVVPLSQLQGLTQAQIHDVLLTAVKAVRASSLALTANPTRTDLGISGQVQV